MTDKPKHTVGGYSDFQEALNAVGPEAMESAINSAFEQLTRDDTPVKAEAPPEKRPASGKKLKELSIESMEDAIASAFGGITGETYTCSIQSVAFTEAGRLQIDLALHVDSDL